MVGKMMDNEGNHSIFDLASHNDVELLLWDQSVLVSVSPGNQLLQLLLRDIFAQLLRNSPQIFDRDIPSPLVIEESKDFVDVGSWIFVVDSLGHQPEPLSEIDGPIAVGIEVSDHLEDGSIFRFES